MPFDVKPILNPRYTALLTNEMQTNIIHADTDLARNARSVLKNIVRLTKAARDTSVPVVHTVKQVRRDSLGRNRNIVLYQLQGVLPDPNERPEPNSKLNPGCEVIPELGPDERDLVMTRLHGIGAVHDSGVDPVLRILNVSTVVVVGVSLNVGITSSVMDLVNRGYDVVVASDAVAGTPASYQQDILENTIRFLARIVPTESIIKAWFDYN